VLKPLEKLAAQGSGIKGAVAKPNDVQSIEFG
jgi:hypothetical protein